MVLSALLIPVDLYQLIVNSVKIHQKSKSEVVKNTEKLTDYLQRELWFLLKDKGYALVVLERLDKEEKKHSLLVTVEESSVRESLVNPYISLEDIYVKKVVIADYISEEIDPVLYEKLLTKWISHGGNEEDDPFEELLLSPGF